MQHLTVLGPSVGIPMLQQGVAECNPGHPGVVHHCCYQEEALQCWYSPWLKGNVKKFTIVERLLQSHYYNIVAKILNQDETFFNTLVSQEGFLNYSWQWKKQVEFFLQALSVW